MFCHTHFFAGLLAGVTGYKLQFIGLLDIIIISVAATLIDIDHLVLFLINKKSLNPKRFLKTMAEEKNASYRSFLHRKHFIILMVLVTIALLFFSKRIAFIIASAYFSHILLDFISTIKTGLNNYKILNIKGFSVVWSKLENITFLIIFMLLLVLSL